MLPTTNNPKKIIVVGGGLSGLVSSCLLAKAGYAVVLVEKEKEVGGCLQNFCRRGYRFETGMHYFGAMGSGEFLSRLFRYLEVLDKVEFSLYKDTVFDRISIGGNCYDFCSGFDLFEETFTRYFPNEKEAISNYISTMKSVVAATYSSLSDADLSGKFLHSISFDEYYRSLTSDKQLQKVLMANRFLYAGIEGKTPAYTALQINGSLISSACRIVGGGSLLALALRDTLLQYGGEVICGAEVVEFVSVKNRISELVLKNDNRLKADYFISSLNPKTTLSLVHSDYIRPVYRYRIEQMGDTISSFSAYIVFKPNRVKHLDYNLFLSDNLDGFSINEKKFSDFPQSIFYRSQPSGVDSVYAASAEAISTMPFEWVDKWKDMPQGKRGVDYEEFKRKAALQIIAKLSKEIPEIEDSIEAIYTSSPLSWLSYTASPRGSMYGLAHDCRDISSNIISPRTKLENLLLTGQSLMSHGMLGTAVSGVLTARCISPNIEF